MKFLFALVLVVAAFMSCGCADNTKVHDNKLQLKGTIYTYEVREFEYGGCEYIAFGESNHFAVTHKGNCKYCAQRNK